jgi:hypothetical protein
MNHLEREEESSMDDQREAEGVSTPGSRPRALQVLMALEGVNSLVGVIWPMFVPTLSQGASQALGVRPVVLVMVNSLLSLIHLVIASGLWMRRQWAFRAGVLMTVFTIAIDIFVLLFSITQTILHGGALLALVLNCVVLSLFLHPDVIRTVIAWKQRG